MKCLLLLVLFGSGVAAMPPVPRVILPDAEPPTATTGDEKDPVKLAERIAKTSRAAGEKLAAEARGPDTLRDQKQVKDDLDSLIKLLEKPPPQSKSESSSSSSPPPPKNDPSKSGSPIKQPQGGEPPPMPNSGQKPEPGEQKDGQEPMPKSTRNRGGQPMPPADAKSDDGKPGGAAANGGTMKSTLSLPLEESIARDFWGHLPDAPRQWMMQFFREQYMPKYKDLLGDYYQSLSEKEKPAGK